MSNLLDPYNKHGYTGFGKKEGQEPVPAPLEGPKNFVSNVKPPKKSVDKLLGKLVTHEQEIEKDLAKELERRVCEPYGWTDEEFDIWWYNDKRNHNHAKQQEAAKVAIDFLINYIKKNT